MSTSLTALTNPTEFFPLSSFTILDFRTGFLGRGDTGGVEGRVMTEGKNETRVGRLVMRMKVARSASLQRGAG